MRAVPQDDSPNERPRPRQRSTPDLTAAVEALEASERAMDTPSKGRNEGDDTDDDDMWLLTAVVALGGKRGAAGTPRALVLRPAAVGIFAMWAAYTATAAMAVHALRHEVDGHMPPLMIPADGPTVVATALLLSALLLPWAILVWRMLRCRVRRWSWDDAMAIAVMWVSSSLGGYCMVSTRDKPTSGWRVLGTTALGLACLSAAVLPLVRCGIALFAAATHRSVWRWEPRVARVVLAATAASALWSGFRPVAVVDVELYVAGLPRSLDGYKLCAISDLHAGPAAGSDLMHLIAEQLRGLGCKALLFNGDIAEGTVQERADEMEELAALSSAVPDGAFFVPGNHEFYNFAAPGGGRANAAAWTQYWVAHGFRSLNNTHVHLPPTGNDKFVLAGVDDPLGFPNLDAALPEAHVEGRPTVLAAHRPFPFIDDAAQRGVAAQLSGHTHGGQLWPVHVPAAFAAHGYLSGMYTVRNTQLYVSDGTVGTYQTRLRLLTRAEITQAILRSQPCPRPSWREADVGVALSYAAAALAGLGVLASLGRCAMGLGTAATAGRPPSQHVDAEAEGP